MSDKAKAYTYAVVYLGLFWLLKDSALIQWLGSGGTIVWIIYLSTLLIPMAYWLRNEPTTSGKQLGALAVIGFIAGVLAGKKID